MYPGYSLKVDEYRHPHEFPIEMAYLVIGIIATILVSMFNVGIVISVFIGFAIIFLYWYLSLRTAVASNVRVSPTQFPEIYQLAAEAARRLDMPLPEIYVEQSPVINAYAKGFSRNNHQISLTTGIIEAMSPKELQFIIGHELGHIKSKHMLYHVVTSELLQSNPLLKWIQRPLYYALQFLSRVNEYTADRAGMIACGNVYSSIAALTKLAVGKELFEKINLKEYFRQIEEFKGNKLRIFLELERTHPFVVNRIRALAHFYKSAQYQTIKNKLGEGGTSILQQPVMGTMHLLDKIVDKYHPNTQASQNNAFAHQVHASIPNASPQYNVNHPQAVVQFPHQMGYSAQSVATHSSSPPQHSAQHAMVICPACQQQNRTDSLFCFNCGNKLK